MLKRIISLGIGLVAIFTMTACGNKGIEGTWKVAEKGYLDLIDLDKSYNCDVFLPRYADGVMYYNFTNVLYKIEFVDGNILYHFDYITDYNWQDDTWEGAMSDYVYEVISSDQIRLRYTGWGYSDTRIYNYEIKGDTLRIYNGDEEAVFKRDR